MATKKPNVVLMLSDNIGYGDIGAFQGGEIRGCLTVSYTHLTLPTILLV